MALGADTPGINAALTQGGSISGTVTDQVTAQPIPDAWVDVFDPSGDYVLGSYTDSSGHYTVGGLVGGDYKVQFGGSAYLTEWWNDRTDFDSADPVVVALGADTSGVDAALVRGGSISGSVTAAVSGEPVESVYVTVWSLDYDFFGSDWTDSSGHYTVGGLTAGDYKVRFRPAAPYFGEWWDDQSSFSTANPVTVALGADTSGINAILEVGGSISGTVTDQATGHPVEDAWVGVINLEGDYWYGETSTDASGHYTVAGLPGGDYKVEFYGFPYVTEWWNNQPDFDTADTVSVTPGVDTPGIDSALDRGGSISGTVTDSLTGLPIAGVGVSAYSLSLDYYIGSTWTDASGEYTLDGLGGGDYKVRFQVTAGYVTEWWNDQPTFGTADPVAVILGADTPGIDAALAAGGRISGTVTDQATGAPLQYAWVSVYNSDYDYVGGASTDALGHYALGPLPGGDYRVYFYTDAPYYSEWWNDKAGFDSADIVTVVGGSDTPGIDAALTRGGSISGTVTDASSGNPLQNVRVWVYDYSGSQVNWGWTDSSGHYVVGPLDSGNYRVRFWDEVHLGEWWDNKPTYQTADLVTVVVGIDTPGVDAALTTGGGSISGTVTDQVTGEPLWYAQVSVYDLGDHLVGYSWSDATGHYTVGGLVGGDYKVAFDDYPYVSEWWNDKPDSGSADSVTVVAGADTSGIDGALSPSGSISGQVTADETGDPIRGVQVIAWSVAGGYGYGAETDASGNYTIDGLRGGDYNVEFWPDSPYASEWWNDKPDGSTADVVGVVAGADTPGIDAALTRGGSISGTVTDEVTDSPLADVLVLVYDGAGDVASWVTTDSAGAYSAGGLHAGDYTVRFSNPPYVSEWWDNRFSFDTAEVVTVTAGLDTPDIDAALATGGGSISGSVTRHGTGLPLAGVWVYAYDLAGHWIESDDSDAAGHYSIAGLPAGGYKVEFWVPSAPGWSEWWQDKADQAAADPVAVVLGVDTAGIDGALGPDEVPPVVTPPADMTVEATGPTGRVVNYPAATAIDVVGVTSGPDCVPVSGSVFSLGATTVTCTASDAAGNVGTGTFIVTVQDTTPPVVTPPADMTVEATGAAGATVSYPAATATDVVGVASGPTCAPAAGSVFPLGATTVTCTASDAAGNVGTGTFIVTVQDTTPPVITLVGAAHVVVAVGAIYTDSGATAADVVDGDLTAAIVSVDPVNTAVAGVYTVTYNVTDSHGNTATQASRTVEVAYFCAGLQATIVGTSAGETLRGTAASEVIVGLGGNDTIYGGSGNDTICGGSGNDAIYGDAGNDKLYGENGNDKLDGGSGNDTLSGGSGGDTVTYASATAAVTVNLTTGTATGFGTDTISTVEHATGSKYGDTLRGNAGANTIYGGSGNDTIYGGSGNDALYGDAGNDKLYGENGNDKLDGGPGVDIVDGGANTDTCLGETRQYCEG